MAKRTRLGIPFNYNANWIAGAYYVVNIVKALNLIEDRFKPDIKVFYTDSDLLYLIDETKYPYLNFVKQNNSKDRRFFVRGLNKISRILISKNLIENRISDKSIDMIYPANNGYYFGLVSNKKKKFWIPDFQEHFLPEFFSKEELLNRKNQQKELIKLGIDLVFSSFSAEADFKTIYPDAKNRTSVLQFAVFHNSDWLKYKIEDLKKKFDLSTEYYFCANQFWAHKNHITIFKSLALLKNKGVNKLVVFSGAQNDYRNPDLFDTLYNFVIKEGIHENVRFLGFIERGEQLCLMKNSISVIQPSLFEGWSTVVEDAKALKKHIILSDLPVHREQITKNVAFFQPENEIMLADLLENSLFVNAQVDYSENQKAFANDILKEIISAKR